MNSINVSNGCAVGMEQGFPRRYVIECICAICGAGKTTSYTAYIKNTTTPFIVACKSNLLLNQVYDEMIRQGVDSVMMICGEETDRRKRGVKEAVTTQVIEAVTQYASRVILVTHAGLELMAGYIHDNLALRAAVTDYVVIVDEHPNYTKPFKETVDLSLKDEYRWFAHTVSRDGQRFCVNPDGLRRALVNTKSRRLVIALLNGDVVRETVSADGNTLTLKGAARSDLFALATFAKSFILVAARADKLPFAVQGKEYGLALVKNAQIVIDERRNSYRNQSRVDLGFFVKGSATKRRTVKQLEKIAEHIAAYMVRMGHTRFLFACNIDKPDGLHYEGAEWESVYRKHLEPIGGVWVPYTSHGLNEWNDYTVTLWLGIGKLPPYLRAMLSEEVAAATDENNTCEAGYQFAARSALRNVEDDKTHLTLLSLDEDVMKHLQKHYLPGANILDVPRFELDEGKSDHSKRTFTKGQKTKQRVIAECERLTLAGLKVTAPIVSKALGDVGESTVRRILKEFKETS